MTQRIYSAAAPGEQLQDPDDASAFESMHEVEASLHASNRSTNSGRSTDRVVLLQPPYPFRGSAEPLDADAVQWDKELYVKVRSNVQCREV